jgi:hypothetical protein
MPRKRRTFVSATTRDIGNYRRLACESLRKRGNDVNVDVQEEFSLNCQEVRNQLVG